MMARGWGRVVNITSQSVKAPIPALGLSNAARTGLTGYVARHVAGRWRTRASRSTTCCPGIHATDRADLARRGRGAAEEHLGRGGARAEREATIPARRYGTAEEFGAMCAFLCSHHAGFIVGQNILLDGGAMNSTL